MNHSSKYFFILLVLTFGSCESFFNEDISQEEVVILAPQDGTTVTSNPVRFSWEFIEFALDYQLQVAEPNFNAATRIVLDTILRQNTFEIQLDAGDYEWRIKAFNPEYETEFFTNNFRNNADIDFASSSVQLLLPENNDAINSQSVLFDWADLENATEYRWQLSQSGNIIEDDNLMESRILRFLNDGSYQWQVRATDGSENTLYASRTFEIDTVNPNSAILTTPPDDSFSVTGSVDFEWNRVDRPGSRELDSIFIYQDVTLSNLYTKEEAINKEASINSIPSGTYYWQVKSYDVAGNESQPSITFTIIIN